MSANPSRLGLKLLLVLLVLGGIGFGAVMYFRPVAVVHVIAKGNAANVVPASVTIEAGVVTPIASEADGMLMMSKLSPGAEVKAGDVIAEIDSAQASLEVERVENELKAAKDNHDIETSVAEADEKIAATELETADRQLKLGNLVGVDFDRKKLELDRGVQVRRAQKRERERRVAELEIALKSAKLKVEKMKIKAPHDGTVTEVFVNEHSLVANKQPIALLIPSTRRVVAKIPEEQFALVKEGQRVRVSLIGYPRQEFAATVDALLPTSEEGTQRYTAYLKMQDPPDSLKPGNTGDAAIYIDEHPDVVLVPRRAIQNGTVYVVDNGRVRLQSVDLGYTDLNFAEVTKGLQPGDQVIVERLDTFRDGQRVQVMELK